MVPWLTTTLGAAAAVAFGWLAYLYRRSFDIGLADERLLLTVESAGKVAWDWDLASGRDLWIGDLKTMFGIDARRFSGRVEEFHRRVHPDDRAAVAGAVAESRSNKTPYAATFRVLRPDGQTRWVNANGAFTYGADGRPIRMVGIATDITEQAESEAALRESEQHFRDIADFAPALLWLAGVDGRCTYFNRSWLEFTGRRMEEELGAGRSTGVHPEDLRRTVDRYLEAFAARDPFVLEYRLRRHDGEYRWLLDVGAPRVTAGGAFLGYIGSAIDITERKAARVALSNLSHRLMETQEMERSRIAKQVEDDIGQRVALLTIDLDGLVQTLPGGSPQVQVRVDQVRSRADDLANHLHALSRRLHSSRLELLGIVAAARSYCRELSEQENVTVDFVAEDVPDALSGRVSLALFRVLQEALTNAVMHSGVRHFEVTLRAFEQGAELEVCDRGAGFDPRVGFAGQGAGLVAMTERLNVVRGNLSIASEPGAGTTVRARVALDGVEDDG